MSKSSRLQDAELAKRVTDRLARGSDLTPAERIRRRLLLEDEARDERLAVRAARIEQLDLCRAPLHLTRQGRVPPVEWVVSAKSYKGPARLCGRCLDTMLRQGRVPGIRHASEPAAPGKGQGSS